MEDKIYALLEKLSENMNDGFARLDSMMDRLEGRMDGLEGRMDGLESRMSKLELNQELFNDKLEEAFEAISTYAEVNEGQHQDILNELRGEISVVELAVKRIAK